MSDSDSDIMRDFGKPVSLNLSGRSAVEARKILGFDPAVRPSRKARVTESPYFVTAYAPELPPADPLLVSKEILSNAKDLDSLPGDFFGQLVAGVRLGDDDSLVLLSTHCPRAWEPFVHPHALPVGGEQFVPGVEAGEDILLTAEALGLDICGVGVLLMGDGAGGPSGGFVFVGSDMRVCGRNPLFPVVEEADSVAGVISSEGLFEYIRPYEGF